MPPRPSSRSSVYLPLSPASSWVRGSVMVALRCRSRAAFDQLLETRAVAQRIESGIQSEPAGREIERHPEQRLELIERELRLADQDVGPGQLELDVSAVVSVAADRHQLDASLSFPQRLGLAAQVPQGDAEDGMALPVVRVRPDLLLERETRRVG